MSWIQKLYETYENNTSSIGVSGQDKAPLLPLYHTIQNAQIEVVLDENGNISRAAVVSKDDTPTVIPATEESAGRAGSKLAPHPLCDNLQYVAGDYLKWGGNPNKKKNESGYDHYINALRMWVNWSKNKNLRSVLTYLSKGTLITDLVKKEILWGDHNGYLIEHWSGSSETPPIFKAIKLAQKKGQYEAFIRFSVETPGEMSSNLWNDITLRESWCQYYPTLINNEDLCMALGKKVKIASNHPKNIRYPGDGAKLISSNDKEGFTYRGRFAYDTEACAVGIEVTQKAHNALRWLIARQGKNGAQTIVAWAVSGAEVPDPVADTLTMLFQGQADTLKKEFEYTAQEIGLAIKKLIGGYSAKLGATDDVVIMGLDSAMPGKGGLSIIFYRELTGSDFLKRVQEWHDLDKGCTWRQYFGKDKIFVGAPSPRDIAECAYGKRVDEKLRKATVERLLPCIVDGTSIPRDLVDSCVHRASDRNGLEHWEFEKSLGIACALYKHYHKERDYKMTIECDRKTRDYLYGRLLAVADNLEAWALRLAGEDRPTNAARMMQRFADHPCSTWRTIELALVPYQTRLGNRANKHKSALDEIMKKFTPNQFSDDSPLTGEFLLGYHVQRADFWKPDAENESENNVSTTTNQ